ncbi:MAG: DUF4097 family beta strand repeat protein [Clostridia bacterium]|nr:DUF4097 family beta strand repeat protein [Clostridia bacterium]
MKPWQKTIKYLALAFAILLSVSIISGIIGVFASFSFVFGRDDNVGEMQAFDIKSSIDSIEVDIGATELTIKEGNAFKVESNHRHLTVKENNGCLEIIEKKQMFVSYTGKTSLTLYVPANFVFETADITTGSGRVNIQNLSAHRLKLELGAGEVNIERLMANIEADINGGTGKYTVKNGNINNLDMEMGVGEMNLSSRLTGDCSMSYGIGAANIVLFGNESDYSIEIENGIGHATLNGESMQDNVVYGNGKTDIDIEGGIGDLKIKIEQNNAE